MKLMKKQNKEPVVVLNSGGFDSVVMMNCLHLTEPDKAIHSLHFLYGARNEAQQLKCVEAICKKCGAVNKVIKLPPFDWTFSQFYNKGFEFNSQYLEYRNLVFLSYAISYAQAVGAKQVYIAVLADGQYNDTNSSFLNGLNAAIKQSGVTIVSPFNQVYKEDLLPYAVQAKMLPEDFFSCDDPDDDGNPCGVCRDCASLEYINRTLRVDSPIKAFYRGDFEFSDPEFKRLLGEQRPREVRALINNECQLKCSHCFYGFDEMKGEPLSREEYYEVLKELVLKHHITNIHFSGKEPLFNSDILWYADRIKRDKLPCTFNVVTNGVNVPKYADQLKNLGVERIFLSVDDVLDTNGVRSVSGVTEKALAACKKARVKVEVFIDLHHKNFNKVADIVTAILKQYKVDQIYVRTIRSIGNAEDFKPLTGRQLDTVLEQLKTVSVAHKDVKFVFNIGIEYLSSLDGTALSEVITDLEDIYSDEYGSNLFVRAEEFCSRYSESITLTPDGYLLGCASEVSCPNYDKTSVGNVRDTDLETLLERGKQVSMTCNDCLDGETSPVCTCKFLCETP